MGQRCEVVCTTDPFEDVLPTGARALWVAFTLRTGFFQPFREHFQVPVKTLDYTPWQKLQTLLCSLAVGCTWTKDINHKLRPYPLAAQLLGRERFPDQSSVNRFLHQLGSPPHQQLELISELLLQHFGLWQQHDRVDLDIDSSGLMVYGRTYEGRRKGYFPRPRGRHGYRVTIASTHSSAGPEILSLFLDPANISAAGRLGDCLYQAADVLGSLDRLSLIRGDAAFGSGPQIQERLELGPNCIVQGFGNKTAIHFAARVEPDQWQPLDLFTRVCELGTQRISHCHHPVRVVLAELMTHRQDRRSYSHLYTNLLPSQADAEEIFTRYNHRQGIEALIKTAKHGLPIAHLRTRGFASIPNFLQVAAITFNLLSWFRHYLLAQVQLQDLGLCDLIEKLMDIPAKCAFADGQLQLSFPAQHPLTPSLSQVRLAIPSVSCKS